jgi:hypothetical protein
MSSGISEPEIACRVVSFTTRALTQPEYSGLILSGFMTMDDEFCLKQAKTVRDLAEKADPLIKKRLLKLAEHYERRISIGAKETDPKIEGQRLRPRDNDLDTPEEEYSEHCQSRHQQ